MNGYLLHNTESREQASADTAKTYGARLVALRHQCVTRRGVNDGKLEDHIDALCREHAEMERLEGIATAALKALARRHEALNAEAARLRQTIAGLETQLAASDLRGKEDRKRNVAERREMSQTIGQALGFPIREVDGAPDPEGLVVLGGLTLPDLIEKLIAAHASLAAGVEVVEDVTE